MCYNSELSYTDTAELQDGTTSKYNIAQVEQDEGCLACIINYTHLRSKKYNKITN